MPHIHDKIDFTVETYIVYKNKVLLRKHDKLRIWLSVGGHIELDENPNQAAIREVKEEVGLDIVLDNSRQLFNTKTETYQELIPPYFLNIHQSTKTHQHISLIYFAKTKSDKISQNKKNELSEDIRWFTKEDLEKDNEIHKIIKLYALEALKKLAK
ncbi:MAG: NUDIX domain-containing protein [Candidatus Daviesbacteria bacterium]|nr:NUDIX domain-containing protein [Candidatus Daviesbacteria bacterium]